MVGGIVVNKTTGYTIVGGHQKVAILDELNKYNTSTQEGDYVLRVELIEVDLKTEKELNITLNNHRVGGDWDYDALRELLPSIDYDSVGFTAEDLTIIGVDYYMNTPEEEYLSSDIEHLYQPIEQERQQAQLDRAQSVANIKALKSEVNSQAQEKAQNLDAYVVLSFDSFKAKAEFCEQFGYDAYEKFLKGEVFIQQIEGL